MNNLSNVKIKNLYTKLLKAASLYSKLIDYEYLIIIEPYNYLIVRFRKEDFIHLTGLKLTISDNSFFKMFNSQKFLESNIRTTQKYTYREINKKLGNIIKMYNCLFLNNNSNKLIIKKIYTNTRDYPYGIVGNGFILCLDGNKKFYPKSIRDDKLNTNYDDLFNIIAIFNKKNSKLKFDDIVYWRKY